MSSQLQKQYRETIKGLESRLTQLLDGRASDVDSVVTQLKQAEQVEMKVETPFDSEFCFHIEFKKKKCTTVSYNKVGQIHHCTLCTN